jgi:hypothetical protein
MTPAEIRTVIAASTELQALAQSGAFQAVADTLSVGRMEVGEMQLSARGLARHMGALETETILLKLETARDSLLQAQDATQRLLGSALRRQLRFLEGDGLDFGAPAMRAMLDQFGALNILTEAEVTALKALAERPAAVLTEYNIRHALAGGD